MHTLFSNEHLIACIAAHMVAYHKKHYLDGGYLDGLVSELKSVEVSLRNIISAIERGAFSDTLQQRLTDLELQKSALTEAIETEKIKMQMMQDSDSIQAYFKKYLNADLDDIELRNALIEYFVGEVYLKPDDSCNTSIYYCGVPSDDFNKLGEPFGFESFGLESTT